MLVLELQNSRYCGIGKRIDTDPWTRMENSEINTHKYTQLIFDEETTAIQLRMFPAFNKCCRSNWPKQDRKKKKPKCHLSLTSYL